MDSINRQQPEQTHADLSGHEAIHKMKALAKQAATCFFCTRPMPGRPLPTRPMSVQHIDEQGSLWFLSANDSRKNQELAADSQVQLLFQGSAHSDFMTLYGVASITTDRDKIRELWEPILKTWFTKGVDDPRITVIEVRPQDGYYWDTKHNRAIALAKMTIGALTGKTLDDSVEGKLQP